VKWRDGIPTPHTDLTNGIG
jgi:hypothetical protein